MDKHLFVIVRYNNVIQKMYQDYIAPKNKDYCERHGIQYIEVNHDWDIPDFRGNITWMKFYLVQEWIKKGILNDGDSIVNFDADMVVVKPELEYKTDKSFSYAIDSCNSHCMGNYCININDWSKKLVNDILDENLYQTHKHTRHWKFFREQAAWYTLAGIDASCKQSYLNQGDYGFHSVDTGVYSLEELREHVDVKPPIWDCTLLEDEIDNRRAARIQSLFINKTQPKDTIIRHFSARQPWRRKYL